MKTIPTILTLLILFPSFPLLGGDEEEAVFTQAVLDQMLAPIALYPDALLAQILTASTYPLEVVQAARWSQKNPDLEGADAVEAVADEEWDPSVKALVAFPQVLARMDEDLEWTRRLGDAFLAQDEEMMASVQNLRQKAYAAGSLESLEHVKVKREREVIVIEPADPTIVYVPYYRPTVVYGSWWWPHYPPVYWGPPASYSTVYYSTGRTHFVWSSGIVVRSGFFFSTCDWRRRQIVVHHHYHDDYARSSHREPRRDWSRYSDGDRWRHEPAHRRGVTYRSEALNQRYGRTTASIRAERDQPSERSFRIRPPANARIQDGASREERPSETASDPRKWSRAAAVNAARERRVATTRRPEDRMTTQTSRSPGNSVAERPRTVTTPSPRAVTTASNRSDASESRQQRSRVESRNPRSSIGRAAPPPSRTIQQRAPRRSSEQRSVSRSSSPVRPKSTSSGTPSRRTDWRGAGTSRRSR